MPYSIRKLPNKNLYRVYNTKTKAIHSYATTLENAKKQIKLLHMVDAGVPLNASKGIDKADKKDKKKGDGLEKNISTNDKMENKWIQHVKEYASKHKMSYRDALRDCKCREEYKKGSGLGSSKSSAVSPEEFVDVVPSEPEIITIKPEDIFRNVARGSQITPYARHITKTEDKRKDSKKIMSESQANALMSGKLGPRARKYGHGVKSKMKKCGAGVIDESEFADQKLLAIKYNDSELGANAGKKFISL